MPPSKISVLEAVDRKVKELFHPFIVGDVNESQIKVAETALSVQGRYKLSYWDSQIIAAAERLGADVLYSEELKHGKLYGYVRCENPFRSN
jgi:predicted nucleic acid-binding protein